jgi:hypothetical protein
LFGYFTGLTLYAIRYTLDDKPFLTDGSSYETYGDSGHDADDYDVEMLEIGAGNYFAHFDEDGNITTAGDYPVLVYEQAGANPADTDIRIAQGIMHWDGSTEIFIYDLDYRLTATENYTSSVLNVYDETGTRNSISGVRQTSVQGPGKAGGVYARRGTEYRGRLR